MQLLWNAIHGGLLLALLFVVEGCACQSSLQADPPPDNPLSGNAINCACSVLVDHDHEDFKDPVTMELIPLTFDFDVCVPAEFQDDAAAYCGDVKLTDWVEQSALTTAEREMWVCTAGGAEALNKITATCTASGEPMDTGACEGQCQSVPCVTEADCVNDPNCAQNCTEEDIVQGLCECTVPTPCGLNSPQPVCQPMFPAFVLPEGSEPLSLGLGAGGPRPLAAMPGTWSSGSSMTTKVDAQGCFLFFCQSVQDEATAAVDGDFDLYGRPCPGDTCQLGFSTKARVSTYTLDLDQQYVVTDMVIRVESARDALTVGPDGSGIIAPGTLSLWATGKQNSAPKKVLPQLNATPIPFTIDWATNTFSVPDLEVVFPSNEGSIVVELTGTFGDALVEQMANFDLDAPDADADGVPDPDDNCPLVANPEQDIVESPVIALTASVHHCTTPELVTPSAEDVCFGTEVTLTSDAPVEIGPGITTVTWTAVDGGGRTTTAEQLYSAVPAILATSKVSIGSRASVAGEVGIASLGSSVLVVEPDARVSATYANGPIDLRDRSRATDILLSGSNITFGNNVVLPPGGWFANAEVPSWDLSGLDLDFAVQAGPTVHLEPGQAATVGPGHYASLIVKSGSNLTLVPGDYYASHLQLEPQGVVSIQGNTRLFVASSVIYRGTIQGAGRVTLGYAGQNDLMLEQVFVGDVRAPNARVTLGAGSALTFRGTIAAREVTLRPDVSFVCE